MVTFFAVSAFAFLVVSAFMVAHFFEVSAQHFLAVSDADAAVCVDGVVLQPIKIDAMHVIISKFFIVLF